MSRYRVTVDGRVYDVEVDDPRADPVTARVAGAAYAVNVEPARDTPADTPAAAPSEPPPAAPDAPPRTLSAPMPGVVAKVTASAGRAVARGDGLLTIEAMKMLNVIRSPWVGEVQETHVREGDHVVQGQPLVTLTPR